MLNIDNWKYFYKIDPVHRYLTESNLLYTPLINPEGNVMCMWWDINSQYQPEHERLTIDLIDFFFNKELTYLTKFQNKPWTPKIIDLDQTNKKIYMEWNKETLNNIIYTDGRSLDVEIPNWQEQIFAILKDIYDMGYYKMALYPHCFFIDALGQLKTFDFYSTIERSNPYIERKRIEPMIGELSAYRFDEATRDGMIDFDIFFKGTLTHHLVKAWPNSPFPDFYNRLINNIQ